MPTFFFTTLKTEYIPKYVNGFPKFYFCCDTNKFPCSVSILFLSSIIKSSISSSNDIGMYKFLVLPFDLIFSNTPSSLDESGYGMSSIYSSKTSPILAPVRHMILKICLSLQVGK